MTAPVLEARGLYKAFGDTDVLRGVDLSIAAGSIVGLLGANGSGKSTFIKCALGLLRPTAGTVSLLGEDPWRLSVAAKTRLGYVPQELRLYPWMTVETTTKYWGAFYANWDRLWVATLIERWQLPPHGRVNTLSAGQLQRLGLILALGHHPELLILDEPVAALDPAGRREFLRSLVEVTQDGHHTVLFSTHILSDLERVASHVALLADGKIQFADELDAIKDRFKRLHITAAEPLPASFSVAGALRVERRGREAVVSLADGSDELIEELRQRWQAQIEVEHLNLEDIFMEYHDAAAAPVESRSPMFRR